MSFVGRDVSQLKDTFNSCPGVSIDILERMRAKHQNVIQRRSIVLGRSRQGKVDISKCGASLIFILPWYVWPSLVFRDMKFLCARIFDENDWISDFLHRQVKLIESRILDWWLILTIKYNWYYIDILPWPSLTQMCILTHVHQPDNVKKIQKCIKHS